MCNGVYNSSPEEHNAYPCWVAFAKLSIASCQISLQMVHLEAEQGSSMAESTRPGGTQFLSPETPFCRRPWMSFCKRMNVSRRAPIKMRVHQELSVP